MDTSLAHLPQHKQDDLQRLVAMIREHCPDVAMIILFGSYARGDWRESKDLAPDRRSGHASDYDILAITDLDDGCDWYTLSRSAEKAGLTAYPRLIHHEIEYVNRQLEKGQYFFSDIVAEGKMLYDSGEYELASARSLTKAERLDIAREHYEHWFRRAEEFWGYYETGAAKGWRETAAFNLHQASESCYKTALLIFTGYIPDEHYLALLGQLVADVEAAFADLFASDNEFEKDAFTLLEYAYIGARYDKGYSIDQASLDYLAERVAALMDLTRERCLTKIAALETAGE